MKQVAHVLWRSDGGIRRHVHYVASHPPSGWTTSAIYGHGSLESYFDGLPFQEVTLRGLVRGVTDADVVHAHGFTAGLCALRPVRPPTIVTMHVVAGLSGRTADSPVSRALARATMARADALVAPSSFAARGAKRVRIVAPAFAPPAAGTRGRDATRVALDASGVVVLCVARLDRSKHLDVFVRAVEQAQCSGWIVGDGPERARLEELVGGTRVRLLGQRSDVADLLAAADIFALPSVAESYGIAVAEAIDAGLPVVATDTGAHEEIVGEAGLVVPVGDDEAFIAAVRLLAEDANERGLRARAARAKSPPDPTALVAELGRIYDELATAPASRSSRA